MENNQTTIGKEFTIGELARFVAAPVGTRLLMSLLRTLDDSLFLSRYCGKDALSAFSILMPWFMFVDAFGMVYGAVGTISSMKLGEKKRDEAESNFSTILIVAFCTGLIFSLTLTLFRRNILGFLGATERLMPLGIAFTNVSRFYTPLVMMSFIFPRFYVIAGKPKHSMITMAISTFCNFFFDWLFIVKLQKGIVGTAYANLAGQVATTLYALIFFSNKDHEIAFGKPDLKNIGKLLKEVAVIGRPQFLTSLALSLNSFINNQVVLGAGGEDMVAAYTIVSNIQFMFMESFFGLVGTTSPIISYAYGEKNVKKLARIIKQTAFLVTCLLLIIMAIIVIFRDPLMSLYMGENDGADIIAMVKLGLSIIPFGYLPFGYNVMVQEMATAVGNAKTSTFLSTLENVVLANVCVLALPVIFGPKAIWYTFLVCESLTFLFTAAVAYLNRNKYGYGKKGIAAFSGDIS